MADRIEAPLSAVRYKKPKITLIDLLAPLGDQLSAAGYNITVGTFGCPYKVKKGDGFFPVIVKASVPNYAEQEIVVIDLTPPKTAEGPTGEKVTANDEPDWYVKASIGTIDPRPRVMTLLRNSSDRILKSGGVFVIFAEAKLRQPIVLAAENRFRQLDVNRDIDEDNWSILTLLSQIYLNVCTDHGTEILVSEGSNLLIRFLDRHLKGSTFSATLHPYYPLTEEGYGPIFLPLATSKFGDIVAAVLLPRKNGKGLVLILPQLEDKQAAILDLIQTVFPEIVPELFPDHEGGRWVQREEYEHSSILVRKADQLEVQRKANQEVSRLEQEIAAERESFGFLHGLLTKSGNALVLDVKRALEFIGFQKVVDVDEVDDAEVNKQEDLQILDQSPSLLLEIKGLAGMPTEGDTLQVTKYVLRRIRQWNQTDVTGLSLVNHQRNLPALERDHANAFTNAQIQDAKQNGTGLMTTWDLFRLVRGMVRWGWPSETVKNVLYGQGQLSRLPSHYTVVGSVAHYWTEQRVISIDITGHLLRVGDRAGYLFADGFFEEEVTSLQVDKKSVREANPAQRVGMKTALERREVPVGTVVYCVGNRS